MNALTRRCTHKNNVHIRKTTWRTRWKRPGAWQTGLFRPHRSKRYMREYAAMISKLARVLHGNMLGVSCSLLPTPRLQVRKVIVPQGIDSGACLFCTKNIFSSSDRIGVIYTNTRLGQFPRTRPVLRVKEGNIYKYSTLDSILDQSKWHFGRVIRLTMAIQGT